MAYCKKFRFFALVSACILVLGLVMGFVVGPNFGIDFSGGSIFTIEMGKNFETAHVQAALEANGIKGATVVASGATADSKTQAVIRIKPFGDDTQENEARQAVLESLIAQYPTASVAGVDRVGAVASTDLVRNAILSVVIAAACILLYIWVRFELLQGVSAVVALLHDVLIMFAVTVIFRVPINSSFIAAMLTIVGYSINNTIVVFDRVRENTKLYGNRHGSNRAEIVDKSVAQTLTRSINTSITTLVTIVALYILGVPAIKEFALPIIVGLVAGTYSSIFLVAPLWVKLVNIYGNYQENRAKQAKIDNAPKSKKAKD